MQGQIGGEGRMGIREGRWRDPEGAFERSPGTSVAGADVKDQGAPGGGRKQVAKYESKDTTVDQSAIKRGKSGSPQKKKMAIESAGPVSTRQKRIKSGSPSRPAEKMGPPAPPVVLPPGRWWCTRAVHLHPRRPNSRS